MAYTRAWSPTTVLLGSDDSDTIDDKVRAFANDLTERFASILIDVTADPWVLKIAGDKISAHWSDGVAEGNTAYETQWTQLRPANASETLTWDIPVRAPAGATLTDVSASVYYKNTGATLSVALKKVSRAGATSTLRTATPTVANASPQEVGWPDDDVLTDDGYYFISVTMNDQSTGHGNAALIGVTYSFSR